MKFERNLCIRFRDNCDMDNGRTDDGRISRTLAGIPPKEPTGLSSRTETTGLFQPSQIMTRVRQCRVGSIHGSRHRCLGKSPMKGVQICLCKLQERGQCNQDARGAWLGVPSREVPSPATNYDVTYSRWQGSHTSRRASHCIKYQNQEPEQH